MPPAPAEQPVSISVLPAAFGTAPGWRLASGYILPPPEAPELIQIDDANGRGVCIQWPTIVHAVAYTVELLEEGMSIPELFTRTVPEPILEPLVELCVGGLRPGAYSIRIRCVAPCGGESSPSAWSTLPPSCTLGPMLPSVALHLPQPLLSTNPSAAMPLPASPPPMFPPDVASLQAAGAPASTIGAPSSQVATSAHVTTSDAALVLSAVAPPDPSMSFDLENETHNNDLIAANAASRGTANTEMHGQDEALILD